MRTRIEMIDTLREMTSWNDFAASIVSQYDRDEKPLSERQWNAVCRMLDRMEANAKAKAEMTTELDISVIQKMFDTAVSNGLKRPGFICGPIRLSLALPPSRNAGMIYVKFDGVYQGKIGGGTFQPARECEKHTPELLRQIAANPFENAIAHGKETGVCACCGRTLTDKKSVEMGIGPICAKKWGFV